MILSNIISEESAPAEAFVGALPAVPATDCAPVNQAPPDPTTARLQIIRLVNQIEAPQVRQIVGAVFEDLLRLLECLSLIESHLRQVDAAAQTFALFQLIHDEASILVEFIREDGLNCGGMNEELADTLDGITFAVNHDLQRVFETAPHGANSENNPGNSNAHVVIGKLYRSHDLLTNCLQQSTITLAVMFDPELVGAKLFNNSDMRYRQSLQLCDDLSALIQIVGTAEKDAAVRPSLPSLTVGLEQFRSESMECLMYSDWPQFESFCQRIKVAATPAALEPVLHQFRCYLETLLGQVRMRAVLANVFPAQFGGARSSVPFSTDVQQENSPWNLLAVAV